MPKVGGHVSAAISLDLAVDRGVEIGAECIQFFVSPPQQWAQTQHDEVEFTEFQRKAQEAGIGPNFIHGTYLVNLGTSDPEHLAKSVSWLKYGMQMAGKLGVKGVIFHTGSHKGKGMDTIITQVVDSLKQVLAESPPDVWLCLETAAGTGKVIGGELSDLGEILKLVQDDRLRVCLDVQHAFAAGYDVKSLVGLKDVLQEFDEVIGLDKLVAIHANDSKTEYKSGRDRHENIGEGFIGREGFENMINTPEFKDVPFLLEVPGFSGNGPDKENVDLLKSLRN